MDKDIRFYKLIKNKLKEKINNFSNEESGQGMVEYSLIIAMATIVVISVMTTIGVQVYKMYHDVIWEKLKSAFH